MNSFRQFLFLMGLSVVSVSLADDFTTRVSQNYRCEYKVDSANRQRFELFQSSSCNNSILCVAEVVCTALAVTENRASQLSFRVVCNAPSARCPDDPANCLRDPNAKQLMEMGRQAPTPQPIQGQK